MEKPTIVSLGEVLWDLFPDGERFGGAPANFACHAAILGADVTMLSAVGDDRRGREAIRILSGYDIDVSQIPLMADAPTGTVGVELDDGGKPTFMIHENSAWDRLTSNTELASHITAADAVYFGTLGQRSEISRHTIRRAIAAAASAGITRVLDINLRPPFFDAELIRDSIQLASVLKLSDDELPEVVSACGIPHSDRPNDLLRGLLSFGDLDSVVMTRGAAGAVLVTADTIIDQSGIPTTVVDTVGAGDAFTAAFLIGVLGGGMRGEWHSAQQNKTHEDTLRTACEVAAVACSHPGAVPAPTER